MLIDKVHAEIVGSQDGAAFIEVTRRREDKPGTTGIDCFFELLRFCQFVDRYEHPARRQDPQGCGNPPRRVWRPERNWAAAPQPVLPEALSEAQRVVGESL